MKLLEEYIRRTGPLPSGYVDVRVQHDDDCGVYGGGRCDCGPDIFVNGTAIARNGELVIYESA